MNTSFNIDSTIPLTEATLLILLSLAEEPRHGYAIMKDVQELSQGRVIPEYRHPVWRPQAPAGSGLDRPY